MQAEEKKRPHSRPEPLHNKVKPENAWFASRFRQALKDLDWKQADLIRELTRRGIYADPHTNVHNWYHGKTQPDKEKMPQIAAVLGKSMSYFFDPAYSEDVWSAASRLLARLIADVMNDGLDLVAEAERRSGNPRLLDPQARRRLLANQQRLKDFLRRAAPGPWEGLDPRDQLDLIEALLSGESPVAPSDDQSEPAPSNSH